MIYDLSLLAITGFIVLAVLLNIWKPVFVSCFYEGADEDTAATTLSIANQSKTLSVALMAPFLGIAVDKISVTASALQALWPLAACGAAFSLFGLLFHYLQRVKGLRTDP